jgi:hypothetical protein
MICLSEYLKCTRWRGGYSFGIMGKLVYDDTQQTQGDHGYAI